MKEYRQSRQRLQHAGLRHARVLQLGLDLGLLQLCGGEYVA